MTVESIIWQSLIRDMEKGERDDEPTEKAIVGRDLPRGEEKDA